MISSHEKQQNYKYKKYFAKIQIKKKLMFLILVISFIRLLYISILSEGSISEVIYYSMITFFKVFDKSFSFLIKSLILLFSLFNKIVKSDEFIAFNKLFEFILTKSNFE